MSSNGRIYPCAAVCSSCLLGIGLIDFLVSSCFFSCIFLLSAGKKSLLFFHPDHPFPRFFRFIGIFFLSSAEKFFHLIPVFSVLFLNSFRRKSLFFSASASRFRAFFPHLSNHFRAFSRAVWKIFLSVSIIFPLFSGLSGGKIHISRNGFSVRLLSLEGNSSTIPVFGGFRSVFFLPVLCRLLPCFFSVIPIFHPESFAFCGCRLPCFFQLFRHFSVLGAFFLPVLCRRLLCFFPVILIFHLESFVFCGYYLPSFFPVIPIFI